MDIEKIIDISNPVYSFSEIMDGIDFTKYFAVKERKTDIRYMWLPDGIAAPSFATFGNFIRDELTDSIETI